MPLNIILFVSLMGALLYADSIPGHVSQPFRRFIHAQMLFTVVIYSTLAFVASSSMIYRIVFVAASIPVYLAALGLVMVFLDVLKDPGIPVVVALATSLIVTFFVKHAVEVLTVKEIIALVEALFLCFLGIAAAVSAPFCKGYAFRQTKVVAYTMAGLWLSQMFYKVGYALHTTSPTWLMLNKFISCWMVAGAMAWIGWWSRHHHRSTVNTVVKSNNGNQRIRGNINVKEALDVWRHYENGRRIRNETRVWSSRH